MSAQHLLPTRRLSSFPLDRSFNRNTFIEDEPQEELQHNRNQYASLHTIVDDELPVAGQNSRRKTEAFDDLYDMSEDEADELPIRFSMASSNGQATPAMHRRFPSLVIPSPSTWPTIQNYQKFGVDAPLMSPHVLSPSIVSPTPRMLQQLSARPFDTTSAPSLDGSLTSEDLSNLSCPSTPDLERQTEKLDWSSPVQLHPQAMQTLGAITGNAGGNSPMMFIAEMREVNENRPHLDVDVMITPVDYADPAELSALSVPSPGGFFSSLESSVRNTWFPPQEEVPSTSIAERFYGVPWAEKTIERVLEYTREQVLEYTMDDDNNTEGPPTARRIPVTTPKATLRPRTPSPQPEVYEYKENYDEELETMGASNFDRTSMWLQQQNTFEVAEESASVRDSLSLGSPQPKQFISPIEEVDEEDQDDKLSIAEITPKSVSFAVEITYSPDPEECETPVEKTTAFMEAAHTITETKGPADAFIHRKVRTDKFRLDRKCLFSTHIDRLDGKFELEVEEELKVRRPVSDMFGPEETEESQAMAQTLRQRRAIDQIKPVSWNLEATKMLNGGSLLTSPTGKLMPQIDGGRVLDLGGQASCDWAWQVAIEHPSSTVHTVFTSEQIIDPAIQGPANHKQTQVPNIWTLPFPSNHFHLISARNLMSLLKTDKPNGKARDEYDLCLKECMRILKPGGYLEFALLDADIVGGGHQASATSVEFCFNLRTRGYDAMPTKQWLPRLRRAGFSQVRRAWLNLPLAQASEMQGTTADASHISGLVGSWAWERWMLKLHKEMGWEADRLLEGVPAALEEGSRTGASWRYLSGWARKPL